MSEICAGCNRTLQMYDPAPDGIEGDDIWIISQNGEEKTYCESCYASLVQK